MVVLVVPKGRKARGKEEMKGGRKGERRERVGLRRKGRGDRVEG